MYWLRHILHIFGTTFSISPGRRVRNVKYVYLRFVFFLVIGPIWAIWLRMNSVGDFVKYMIFKIEGFWVDWIFYIFNGQIKVVSKEKSRPFLPGRRTRNVKFVFLRFVFGVGIRPIWAMGLRKSSVGTFVNYNFKSPISFRKSGILTVFMAAKNLSQITSLFNSKNQTLPVQFWNVSWNECFFGMFWLFLYLKLNNDGIPWFS